MPVYKGSKTSDGRSYYFRKKYRDIFGMQKDYTSKKYLTKHEAEEEEAKFIIKVNDKTSSSNITLKQAYIEYSSNKKLNFKPQTIIKENYMFEHLESISDLKISAINVQTYKKYKLYLDSLKFTPSYKNKILGVFRRVLEYSHKYYGTSISLLPFIENYKNVNQFKKEMDFFTLDEYKLFSSKLDRLEWKTFFDILFYLGLRQGEVQALTWNDIDFSKNVINVNKTLTTKIKGEKWTISTPKTKNSIRILPLPKTILNEFKNMEKQAIKFKYFKKDLFVFGMVKPFTESNIQRIKNTTCEKVGLRKIRIHDFRHSCASLLINQGASISLVSKYLGHSNITITLNTYTHLYQNELVNITNKLNNLL